MMRNVQSILVLSSSHHVTLGRPIVSLQQCCKHLQGPVGTETGTKSRGSMLK